jgi:hypothetical protein
MIREFIFQLNLVELILRQNIRRIFDLLFFFTCLRENIYGTNKGDICSVGFVKKLTIIIKKCII